LKPGNLLEEASIDKYSFTRDAYLQYRRSQIYDGNPPDEEDSNDDPSANPVPAK
jgi:phospholipid-binding lipoprotein MlaA